MISMETPTRELVPSWGLTYLQFRFSGWSAYRISVHLVSGCILKFWYSNIFMNILSNNLRAPHCWYLEGKPTSSGMKTAKWDLASPSILVDRDPGSAQNRSKRTNLRLLRTQNTRGLVHTVLFHHAHWEIASLREEQQTKTRNIQNTVPLPKLTSTDRLA